MMLLFEVKKVLSKPLNKAALLILAAVFLIWRFFKKRGGEEI